MLASRPGLTTSADCGDYVVVTNARDVVVTGNKPEKKMYIRHTGYPGGFRKAPFKDVIERRPDYVRSPKAAASETRRSFVKPCRACCRRTSCGGRA